MRKKIDALEHANTILTELKKGILLTTKQGDKVNAMTISWGKLGIEWAKPIFTAYVRDGRFTYEQLDSGEFTINVPLDRKKVAKALGFCGTKTGREHDKIKEINLTLVDGENVSVPAIKEFPLTLECKVIYIQEQNPAAMPEEFIPQFYPQDVDSSFHSANKDFHTMFYGEIVNAYILED